MRDLVVDQRNHAFWSTDFNSANLSYQCMRTPQTEQINNVTERLIDLVRTQGMLFRYLSSDHLSNWIYGKIVSWKDNIHGLHTMHHFDGSYPRSTHISINTNIKGSVLEIKVLLHELAHHVTLDYVNLSDLTANQREYVAEVSALNVLMAHGLHEHIVQVCLFYAWYYFVADEDTLELTDRVTDRLYNMTEQSFISGKVI